MKTIFKTFLKKIFNGTTLLIAVSCVLTAAIILGMIYAITYRRIIEVPYSYYSSGMPAEDAVAEPESEDERYQILTLDAVATSSTLSVAIAKNGKRLNNIDYSITICKGGLSETNKENGKSYYDSNSDGVIVIKNLTTGTYSIYINSIEKPYTVPKPVQVSVVEYKPDKNILNKVNASDKGSDDPVKLKNDSAQKNEADEEDKTTVNLQRILPDKDKNGNILYRIDNIIEDAYIFSKGDAVAQSTPLEDVYIKQKDGSSKKISGYVLKRESVDKNYTTTKSVSELLVKRIAEFKGEEYVTYDIYELSCYTHKGSIIVKPGWNVINGKTYYYKTSKKYLKGWQYIGGSRYHFKSNGVMDSVKGIDVSVYQGNIDWEKVAESGVRYAIIRGAYRGFDSGELVVDQKFHKNVKGALNAGIEVGVYVFSSAINTAEAVEEASLLLKLCENYEITFPLIIDIEAANTARTGRADCITKDQRTEIIKAFCETIKAGGRKPMLYTGMSYYKTMINYKEIRNYPLWIAYYPEKEKITAKPTVSGYCIWQYSDKGKVPGIKGRVDMNAMIKRKW